MYLINKHSYLNTMDQMEGDKLVDSFQMQNRVSRISEAQVFLLSSSCTTGFSPWYKYNHTQASRAGWTNTTTNTNTNNTHINNTNTNTNARIRKAQAFLLLSILVPLLVPKFKSQLAWTMFEGREQFSLQLLPKHWCCPCTHNEFNMTYTLSDSTDE